jgi:hypothetical protein
LKSLAIVGGDLSGNSARGLGQRPVSLRGHWWTIQGPELAWPVAHLVGERKQERFSKAKFKSVSGLGLSDRIPNSDRDGKAFACFWRGKDGRFRVAEWAQH